MISEIQTGKISSLPSTFILATDLIGSKLRPVLIISSERLNEKSMDLIVLKISSKTQFPEYEVELTQKDLEEGKIKKRSYVHCHSVFTIEKSLIIKKIARVKEYKLSEIKEKLKVVLDM